MRFIFELNNVLNDIPIDCTEILLTNVKKVSQLCFFLRANTTVKKIILRYIRLGDEEAKEIAETLKINRSVTELDLWANRIGDEGAIAIANALKVNHTVTKLVLSSNLIGDKGAKAIAEALKINRTITTLSLFENEIGEKGAIAFVEALKINCIITLCFLLVGDDEKIATCLAINRIITNAIGLENIYEMCKKSTLALALQVPIYLLLEIFELDLILDIENKTNGFSCFKNCAILKHLEKTGLEKRLIGTIDKIQKSIYNNCKL